MKKISFWLVLVVIAFGVFIRLTFNGDLRLSVGNSDTPTYVESSKVNLLSWWAFTSYRPYTINFVYKIFMPTDGYQSFALSTAHNTVKRSIENGYKDIAVFQSVLSILAWSCLAYAVSSRMKNPVVKVASAAIILLFGFTPQVADWDSAVTSESLSVSLFIFAFAILIPVAFAYHEQLASAATKTVGLALCFVTLFFWIFTRDVNAYSLVILIVMTLALYLIPRFRKTKSLLLFCFFALALFMVGQISARQRPLWIKALEHVWVSDILPSPASMKYFTERGMPDLDSPEYPAWFEKRAPSAYMRFLVAHPVYTTDKFFRDLQYAFAENIQPYFTYNESRLRPFLIKVGDYLHPKSGTVFFAVLFLGIILWNYALFQKQANAAVWAWLATWAFLTASATLFFSIFGDSWGLVRHALSSTITFRLLLWLLLLVVADISLTRQEQAA